MSKSTRKLPPKRKPGRPKDKDWNREAALLYIVTRDFRYTQKCRRDMKQARSEQRQFLKEQAAKLGEAPRDVRHTNLLS
jgi:hypothetical protein